MKLLKNKEEKKYIFEFKYEGKIIEIGCDKWAANEIRTDDIVFPIFLLLDEEKDKLIFKSFESFIGGTITKGGNEFFESLKREMVIEDDTGEYQPEGYN